MTDSRMLSTDPAFETAVVSGQFNSFLPEDRPDEIAFPTTEQEVAELVARAARSGRRVAVRSGGHSWSSASIRDGGLLLDLGSLDSVSLDPHARTATIGPGIRGGELTAILTEAGLAFPVGHCSTPGVGGYLLGGGDGVNPRHWGPAICSVLSIRVVTPLGELITASATENPDWFWLARGAGPAFPGVVTSFELALEPLPGQIRKWTAVYPLAEAPTAAALMDDALSGLSSNVELSAVLEGPGRPGATPQDPDFTFTVTAIAFSDTETEARTALGPLTAGQAAGTGAADISEPLRFDELSAANSLVFVEGARYVADTFWTDSTAAVALEAVSTLMTRAPSARSHILLAMRTNGRGEELARDAAAAFSMYGRCCVLAYSIWDDPAEDQANAAWIDDVATALSTITHGHFLSEADLRRKPERVPGSFTPEAWERIQELRARFDPDEVMLTLPLTGESQENAPIADGLALR